MVEKANDILKPQLRFLEFSDSWKVMTVDDMFLFLRNNTFSRSQMNDNQGEYQNIHYGDVLIKYGAVLDAEKELIPYINDDVDYAGCDIAKDGDIIIADTAEDELAGKSLEIINVDKKKVVSGLHTFWIRSKFPFAPKYLGYFMNSYCYHKQLLPLMQGAKVFSLSKKALCGTKICFPSIPEQQKIADCLSSIDEMISLTQKKLELLNLQKKGMMQRLFF